MKRAKTFSGLYIHLAIALLLSEGGAQPASASKEPTPEEAAEKVLSSYRAKDDAALKAIAGAGTPDLFLVADALLGKRVEAGTADALAAARALAEKAKGRKANARLAALVEAWQAHSEEDLAREKRLREARRRLASGGGPEALEKDLAAAPHSIAAVLVVGEQAMALERAGSLKEAAEGYWEVARRSASIGWRAQEARALGMAGAADFRRGEVRVALETWKEEMAIFEAIEDRVGATTALGNVAMALDTLGQPAAALELFERALKEKLSLGDRAGAAVVLGNLANIHTVQGRLVQALELLERALKEMEAVGDRAGAADTLGNIGVAHEALGRYDLAIECFERSRTEALAAGEPRPATNALVNIGKAHLSQGHYAEALDFFRRGLQGLEALKDPAGVALTLGNMGAVYMSMGEHAKAIQLLERSREESKTIGERGGAASATANLGTIHMHLGQNEKALPLLLEALEEKEAVGRWDDAAAIQGNLAIVYQQLGQNEKALELHAKALKRKEARGDRIGAALDLGNMAKIHMLMGNTDRALQLFKRCLKEAEELDHRPTVALTLGNLGLVYASLGDYEQAFKLQSRSLREKEALGDRAGAAWSREKLAFLQIKLGRPDEALRNIRMAVEMRMDLGRGLGEEEAAGPRAEARYSADFGLLAIRELRDSGDIGKTALPEAFWFAESGRALFLAEGLLNRGLALAAALPRDLVEAESSCRSRIASLQKILGSARRLDLDARQSLKKELDAAYSNLESITARIQREHRRAAQLVDPRPVDFASFTRTLTAGTALLTYAITPKRGLVLLAGKDTLDLLALEETPGLLEKVRSYLDLASSRSKPEDEGNAARALYEALLRPVEKHLTGVTRLLISPDGILSFVPFEALIRVEGEKRERVVERWDVAYVPSGTVYATLREEATAPGRGLLALGDPSYPTEHEGPATADARLRGDLKPLPMTGDEVRAIAGLFPEDQREILLRERATRTAVTEALVRTGERLRAAHFACHGHLDAERPRLTGLVLTDGEVLNLDDIYRMKIPADLAVLSACETGKGKIVSGEGVVGLARGFFFAGCPRVVVSNWKVRDDSTRNLMVSFYGKMIRDGLAPGAALRAAKLDILRAGGPRAHPFHWAGFVLWGLPD